MEQYDEELGYDADHSDNSQYCIHGTFIGSWWGPDYICGYCEDGVSLEDMRKEQAYRRANCGVLTTTISTDEKTVSMEQNQVWRNKVPETYVGEGFTITYSWKAFAEA
jgi:hypothetical protein